MYAADVTCVDRLVGSSAGAEKITTVQEAADLISQQIK